MSYRLFAAGLARGPNFTPGGRDYVDEGDIFEMADVIGKVADRANVRLGGHSKAFDAAINAYATIEMVHLLKNNLAFLKMNGHNPEIWLMSYSNGTLWGIWDQPWNRTTKFRFREDGARALTREFCRRLKELRINRWGIMRGICITMSRYMEHCDRHGYFNPSVLRMEIRV